MKVIRKNQSQLFKNSAFCVVSEYALGLTDLGGAVVEVRGRYPDDGRVVNLLCKETAYILKGEGVVVIEGTEIRFMEGDLILIEAEEKYFWEGNFLAFLSSAPAWNAQQYKSVD